MCGLSGLFGPGWVPSAIHAMIASQHHRGPDAAGTYVDPSGAVALGHNRLSVIDLSASGAQPMHSDSGRYVIVFNGEIYNYVELRAALPDHAIRSRSDTEVLLAAYERWGPACLDRLVGMFAFLVWDTHTQTLFAARDRFGVKPLFYHHDHVHGRLACASEIRAFRAAGIALEPDDVAWATYLAHGVHEHTSRTFWRGISNLPAGHCLTWNAAGCRIRRWYDMRGRMGADFDHRPSEVVEEQYRGLLEESVRLRFRSDVPVAINLSGGLDSSTLLGLVHATRGADADVSAFTFTTGDERYDELPWVKTMLERTRHPLVECRLSPEDVPALAQSVCAHQDEPFGGIPTLAYARLFEEARARGVVVLLDGQGMDEQWAGYDYYRDPAVNGEERIIQGTRSSPLRPDCLTPDFRALAEPPDLLQPFADRLRNLQYRDLFQTKLPRALRFNDRVSMRASVELREPFLDHRLVELALRQPPERKIHGDTGKWLMRRIVGPLLPDGVTHAPKRALQTPQREWLGGPLAAWSEAMIDEALASCSWFEHDHVRRTLDLYRAGARDSSAFLWQWISVGLMRRALAPAPGVRAAA